MERLHICILYEVKIERMKKSELLLNPYKEHLKKPYLHGAGTLEIDGVLYSADEYITMLEEEIKKLKSDLSLVIKERDDNIKQNKKLENKIIKLGTRIYQNIDGEKREEYQEYCNRHKL